MKQHHKSLLRLIKSTVSNPRTGVEVGVFKGDTTTVISSAFSECRMILVDPWREAVEGESYRKDPRMGCYTQNEWDDIYREAASRIEATGKPHTIYRLTSEDAADLVADGSVDFCFLDADHRYEAIKADIDRWWPKVRIGGLLCGHDYGGVMDKSGVWGVKRAVHEKFTVQVMTRPGKIWGVVKGGSCEVD